MAKSQETTPNHGIASKIQKLLKLAGNNPNENEAASAMSKVQELLAQYNLSMADVDATGQAKATSSSPDTETARTKTTSKSSAMYDYQVKLMRAVAEAHFCIYWIGSDYSYNAKTGKYKSTKKHVLVGREANVAVALGVFDYLNGTINRLANAIYIPPTNLSKSALSWKEGCACRLSERLAEKVYEANNAVRKSAPVAADVPPSASTALCLVDLRRNEADANQEFAYNMEPGTLARQRAERAALRQELAINAPVVEPVKVDAKEQAKRDKEFKRWQERQQKRNDRYWSKKDMGAFWAGHEKAETVGLDDQVK